MSTREEKFPSFILNINVSFHCQIKINKNTSNKLPLMEPKHTQIVQWKSEPNDFYGCGGKWVYVCVWQNTLECFFYSTQFFSVFWTTTENTCHTAPDTLSNCQNGRDRMSIAMLYKNDLNNFSVKIHLLSNWMKPYALHTMAVSSKFDAIHVHASRNYIEIEANKRRESGKISPDLRIMQNPFHFIKHFYFYWNETKNTFHSIPFLFPYFRWVRMVRGEPGEKSYAEDVYPLPFWTFVLARRYVFVYKVALYICRVCILFGIHLPEHLIRMTNTCDNSKTREEEKNTNQTFNEK